MKLPPGKTCSDCVHFARCARLVGAKETWTSCDWSPSRFQPRPLSRFEVDEARAAYDAALAEYLEARQPHGNLPQSAVNRENSSEQRENQQPPTLPPGVR